MASGSFAEEIADLYQQESSRMRSYAGRRLPDPQEADDAVNETFADLAALGTLNGIRNPKGWLMTTLNRVVLEALRRKYRYQRHEVRGTFASDNTAPDVAEDYERKERDLLVNESVEALDPDEGRILMLYARAHRPSEIAVMETARGSPTTSRQVTVTLYQAWPKLASQFRKRGVVPTATPLGWLLQRLRLRVRSAAFRLGECVRMLEPATVIPAFALIALLPLSPAGEKSHEDTPQAAPAQDFDSAQDLRARPGMTGRDGDGSSVGPPESVRNPTSVLEIDVAGEQHSLHQWEEQDDRPPPSITDQLLEIIGDPGKIPKPKCGGLPICPED